MASELDEEDFKELVEIMEENISTEFSMDLKLQTVNPYIAIKAPRRLPGTRQELLSSLRNNFQEDHYEKFQLSFTGADKEDGEYIYRILIKEHTNEDALDELE